MILWAAMVAFSGPVSKAEAMKVAERAMTQIGFYTPRAYGAWKQSGYWYISFKDGRGLSLLGVVDPTSGRFLSGGNRSRWPKDVGIAPRPGKPPERAATQAKVQAVVGTRVRLRKWGESWAKRIESSYDVFVGSRLLIGDQGVIRPGLIQDPVNGEALTFYNVPRLPSPITAPDRIKPADAENVGMAAIRATASPKAKIKPPLPARPAIYVPKVGKPVPVWRVRIDTELLASIRTIRSFQDVLVNSQTGKVEAIVPRRDW